MATLHTQIEQAVANGSSPRSEVRSVPKRRIVLKLLLAIIIGLLAYTAFDLLAPRSSRMRSFDPNEVARLETAMWRAYYARQQLQLYNQMTELLRSQYNLPYIRSNTVAYQAARGFCVQGRAQSTRV